MAYDVVNVSSVPHLSPFRYPGGKTWFVPLMRRWLASLPYRPKEFVEPFAGGASVGLAAIFEDLVDQLTLVEQDPNIAAVWRTVFGPNASKLIWRIETFVVTLDNVREVLDASPRTLHDKAFATIVRNRMQHGGIMAPGASLMKAGEHGKGLMSRWYPKTLCNRIEALYRIRKRVSFCQGCGLHRIRSMRPDHDVVWFVDAPYAAAGRRLYSCADVGCAELFAAVSRVRGEFTMTFEHTPLICGLIKAHRLQSRLVGMKNTHNAVKNELVIGRDLSWLV